MRGAVPATHSLFRTFPTAVPARYASICSAGNDMSNDSKRTGSVGSAAMINYRFLAHAVLSTDEMLDRMG
jgi:hypothetical protein